MNSKEKEDRRIKETKERLRKQMEWYARNTALDREKRERQKAESMSASISDLTDAVLNSNPNASDVAKAIFKAIDQGAIRHIKARY